MNKITHIAAAAALTLASSTASAAFLEGGIGFAGTHTLSGCGIADPLFSNCDTISVSGVVIAHSGDFTAATIGSGVSQSPINYVTETTGDPLWATLVGGFSFTLDKFTTNEIEVTAPGIETLTLGGTGYLKKAGFDDTFGSWSFSADSDGVTFTWNSLNGVIAPEPGIALLLGGGLIGFGVTRKLRRA